MINEGGIKINRISIENSLLFQEREIHTSCVGGKVEMGWERENV